MQRTEQVEVGKLRATNGEVEHSLIFSTNASSAFLLDLGVDSS